MGNRLSEATCTMIRDFIQSGIVAALAQIAADRGDNLVSLEAPQSYFLYPRAHGYRTPAIFVIDTGMSFQKSERQANHVSALVPLNISILVEDQDCERLTFKAWRYQAALRQLLDGAEIASQDQKIKLSVSVERFVPTPMYTTAANENDTEAAFRKEIMLECAVNHWEASS